MSIQEASGVDFSILSEPQRQHFRLLELPPELLELLTSEQPPTLQLKSLENAPGQATEQNAVLCTSDKTYNLRQVNTSNSLFVTQLSQGPSDELPQPRLEAISQSNFTLELQAANDVSAAAHIKAALPVYASTGHYQSRTPVSRQVLFSNTPASDGECEQAWTDLACFELEGEALIPSASVRAKIWESVLSAATADGIDLTAPLQDKHLETFVDLNGSDWPREASLAVLRSMASPGEPEGLCLEEKRCAKAVGLALLRDRSERKAIAKSAFLPAWADLLPEKWRGSAELSSLGGSYRAEDGGIVFDDASGGAAGGGSAKAPAEAKSALGVKRKWHEKFRQQASKKAA